MEDVQPSPSTESAVHDGHATPPSCEDSDASSRTCPVPTPSTTTDLPTTVLIDEDGDLEIVVGESNAVTFRVSTSALRRASPFWLKQMLCLGGWAWRQPEIGQKWSVELDEEDPKALRIILDIVHCRFDMVPSKPDLALLYSILILANEYEIVHVLRPWANAWVQVADVDIKGNDSGRGLVMSTFVAWEMGHERYFTTQCSRFLVNTVLPTRHGNNNDYWDDIEEEEYLEYLKELDSETTFVMEMDSDDPFRLPNLKRLTHLGGEDFAGELSSMFPGCCPLQTRPFFSFC